MTGQKKASRKKTLCDASGMSLIELMIGLGIMGIVSFGMATMFSNQQRDIRALGQKQEALQLQRSLTSTFADSRVCSWQIQSLAGFQFNSGGGPNQTNPASFDLQKWYSGQDATSPVLVERGMPFGTYRLIPSSIRLDQIAKLADNKFQAQMIVDWDRSSQTFPLAPLKTTLVFFTSDGGTPNAKNFESCDGSPLISGSVPFSHIAKYTYALNPDSTFSVPNDIKVVQVELWGGGGGACGGDGGAGGGGAYVECLVQVSVGDLFTVHVGAGGTNAGSILIASGGATSCPSDPSHSGGESLFSGPSGTVCRAQGGGQGLSGGGFGGNFGASNPAAQGAMVGDNWTAIAGGAGSDLACGMSNLARGGPSPRGSAGNGMGGGSSPALTPISIPGGGGGGSCWNGIGYAEDGAPGEVHVRY